MRKEHRDIQNWIKKSYSPKYSILAEIDGQNRLPDTKKHWYQPDVIVLNTDGKIEYIIEVENDPMRKAIVGASILADASVKEIQNRLKPTLIFVVYTPQGIRQISNFKNKIEIVLPYCKNLKSIEIYSVNEFKKRSLF
jgi:hypothetical protein